MDQYIFGPCPLLVMLLLSDTLAIELFFIAIERMLDNIV